MRLNGFKLLAVMLSFVSCTDNTPAVGAWSEGESQIIASGTPVMRVLTVRDSADLSVLRKECLELSDELILSEEYSVLSANMLATVTDPSQDGVGIAAPQVGISRRVVCVQRLDKEGEPFETYPNIRITRMDGEMVAGREGCLSVPDCRGEVLRSRDIEISYTSPVTLLDTAERVEGFTAVIFQHECDHLDGILYIDKTLK